MENQIYELILQKVKDLNDTLDKKIPIDSGAQIPLYGKNGCLDSLQLVTLIISIEQAISDLTGKIVSLADEKALSATHSPFENVESLTLYVTNICTSTSS